MNESQYELFMSKEIINFSEYKNARTVLFDPSENIPTQLKNAYTDADFDETILELVSPEGAHVAFVKPGGDTDHLQRIVYQRLIASKHIGKKALGVTRPSKTTGRPSLRLL